MIEQPKITEREVRALISKLSSTRRRQEDALGATTAQLQIAEEKLNTMILESAQKNLPLGKK